MNTEWSWGYLAVLMAVLMVMPNSPSLLVSELVEVWASQKELQSAVDTLGMG